MPSAPLLPQIEEVFRLDVEALGLQSFEHEGAHRHVGGSSVRASELLAQPRASRLRQGLFDLRQFTNLE